MLPNSSRSAQGGSCCAIDIYGSSINSSFAHDILEYYFTTDEWRHYLKSRTTCFILTISRKDELRIWCHLSRTKMLTSSIYFITTALQFSYTQEEYQHAQSDAASHRQYLRTSPRRRQFSFCLYIFMKTDVEATHNHTILPREMQSHTTRSTSFSISRAIYLPPGWNGRFRWRERHGRMIVIGQDIKWRLNI